MQRNLLSFILFFFSLAGYAQSPTINLKKYLGGSGNDYGQFIEKTLDGNFIIIGSVRSADGNVLGYHGGTDIWVAKLSPSGAVLWQRSCGGSSDEVAVGYTYNNLTGSITIISNSESGNGDVTGSRGLLDVWVFQIDNNGTMTWQKPMGGSAKDRALNIITTSDGNLLFSAETASNNFDVIGNHGNSDIWLVKLNQFGGLIWQRCFGGSENDFEEDYGTSLIELTGGSLLFSANTASSNGDVSGFKGGKSDAWVVKTDANGNINWQQCIGGVGNDYIRKIRVTPNGNVVTLVQTASLDMPGYHASAGFANNFDILKTRLSTVGNIITQKCYGSIANETPIDLVIINDSIDVMLAKIKGNGGDISGAHDSPDDNFKDLWFAKTKRDTVLIWQKSLGGSKDEQVSEWLGNVINGFVTGPEMKLLPGGDILYSCISRSEDGDVKRSNPYGSFFDFNIWLFAIDSMGIIKAQQSIGGGSNEWQGASLLSSTGSSYYMVGSSESYNIGLPVTGSTGDILFLKFSGDDYVTGRVYYDKNSNDTLDANETLVNNAVIRSQKTGFLQQTLSKSGWYKQALDTGKYVISCLSPSPYYTASPASVPDTFKVYFRTDTIDFALKPIPSRRDLAIVVSQVNEVRLDSIVKYQITYFNQGTDTLAAGTVVFKKDNRMSALSSNPAVSAVSADSLKWNFTNLKPFEFRTITLNLKAGNTPALQVNDTLKQLAVLIPVTGDLVPIDNLDSVFQVVTGANTAYEKTENHGKFYQRSYIAAGGYLNYTIRYRNTTANTIYDLEIRDTLDINTDSLSFQVIAASHPYELKVTDGKKLSWMFTDLQLPPNSTLPTATTAFVTYRVKLKAGTTAGTVIQNTAYSLPDALPSASSNTVKTELRN